MALSIEQRKVADLIPYARNSRTHSDEQVAQIAASIREFGWTNPVLVDGSNGLIAGHGRLLAARKLGMDEVPAIVLDHLSETQRRALVIADNKLALNAGWNEELLGIEISELAVEDFDLALMGYSDAEIAQILSDGEGTNPEDEWVAMPEFNQADKTAFRTLPVHFANEDDVKQFERLTGQKITEKTRSIWFPEAEIERYADKRYA